MHACIFAHLCPLEVIAVSGDGATHCKAYATERSSSDYSISLSLSFHFIVVGASK